MDRWLKTVLAGTPKITNAIFLDKTLISAIYQDRKGLVGILIEGKEFIVKDEWQRVCTELGIVDTSNPVETV